jgi:hypothetical protein
MPTVVTNYFRQELSVGNVNLSADIWAVALMNEFVSSSTESTLKAQSAWSDVSAFENSAVGYSAVQISNDSISTISDNRISWDGDNITWSSITLSARGHTVYRVSDGLIVGFVDYGEVVEASNGDINIAWNANGIMNII